MKLIITLISTLSIGANANILNKYEAKRASEYLNDICADTYCGGDIHWNNAEVTCSKKYCSLYIDARSFESTAPFFSVDRFNLADSSKKKGQGFKLLSADIENEEIYNDYGHVTGYTDNTIVSSWCRLELEPSLKSKSEEYKIDAVYSSTLDCVDKIQDAIYEL